MPKQQDVYSREWQNNIKSEDLSSSWAGDVFEKIDEDGGVYLSTIKE